MDRSPKAFDLHVLSPPLAFALSQDQTLQFNILLLYFSNSNENYYLCFKDRLRRFPSYVFGLRNESLPQAHAFYRNTTGASSKGSAFYKNYLIGRSDGRFIVEMTVQES
jgi:hypothetical protein